MIGPIEKLNLLDMQRWCVSIPSIRSCDTHLCQRVSFSTTGREFDRRGNLVSRQERIANNQVRLSSESNHVLGRCSHTHHNVMILRNNLLRSSTRLRTIISDPQFEGLFGEAKPQVKGVRSNIFGREDELKVAPKGVAKDHKCGAVLLRPTVARLGH